MRKVSEQEARQLLSTISEARSYIQYRLWPELESSLFRLEHVESAVYSLLGEQPKPHPCYHRCKGHPQVKS